MATVSAAYEKPPVTHNDAGDLRQVGFEIEFGAENCGEAARRVAELYGGQLNRINPHYYKAEDTRLGTFVIELDTQLVPSGPLHESEGTAAYDNEFELFLKKDAPEFFYEWLGDLSKAVVPYEVVTPPIAIDKLNELDGLIDGLRKLGAKGTGESVVYAFGVHINPEAPSLETRSVLNHLRAFLLLSDWLHSMMDIDFTRWLSPYINKFPRDYAQKVVDPDYAPDQDGLIDDYIAANPTRNRELDLLPLLMHIDEERVRGRLDDGLTSSRPTYHYRLPDCRLNDSGWSLGKEWNFWVQVERLAADPERLASWGRDYIEHFNQLIPGDWAGFIRSRL